MAIRLGVAVEDVSQRTARDSWFALPDGHWVITSTMGDRYAVDPDAVGATPFAPIDERLERTASGWWHPALTSSSLMVNPGGSDDRTILRFGPGGTDVVLEVTSSYALPMPRIDGARAIFGDLVPGVDLIVEVQQAGFEIFFVAATPDALSAAESIALNYTAINGTISVGDDELYTLFDAQGSRVGEFAPPIGWDKRTDTQAVSPVLGKWSPNPVLPSQSKPIAPHGNAQVRVEGATAPAVARGELAPLGVDVESQDGGISMTLDAPDAWSEIAGATFPVILDPSLINTYGVNFDTDVNSGYPTSSYSTRTELRLGTPDGGASRYRSFLEVPLAGARNVDVLHAYLLLYETWSWSCQQRPWYVAWTGGVSAGTTWNNQPASEDGYAWATTQETTGYSSACGDDWVSADITDLIKQIVKNDHWAAGLTLRLSTDETDNFAWKRFNSLEASIGRPQVAYYINRPPSTPSAVTFHGSAIAPGANVAYATGPLDLAATVTDPDGDNACLAVTVKRGTGADQRIVFERRLSPYVANGQAAKLDLSPYLAYGEHYTVEVAAYDSRLYSKTSWGSFSFDVKSPAPKDFPTTQDTRNPAPTTGGGQ